MADSIDVVMERATEEIHRLLPLYTEAAAAKARREAFEEAAQHLEKHAGYVPGADYYKRAAEIRALAQSR